MTTLAEPKSTLPAAWSPYVPTPEAPWNLRRVVHLHRRAGFAATWDELQRDLKDGPEASVTRVLTGKARSAGLPADFEYVASVIGDAAVASGNCGRRRCSWRSSPAAGSIRGATTSTAGASRS